MTNSKAQKRIVRDLQELRGCSYTAALRELREQKKKDVARMHESTERLTRALDNETSRYESARTANRKFESDIAKIRTAIGDLRMKEILGADHG